MSPDLLLIMPSALLTILGAAILVPSGVKKKLDIV